MRITDLSQRSGVPVDTIKFYLRERLLPPGVKTANGRTEFGEGHLARLRLARALIAVGRLSVASVRDVVQTVEAGCGSTRLSQLLVSVLPGAPAPTADIGDVPAARARADALVEQLGWRVSASCPSRATLAAALAALWHVGWNGDVDAFVPYADVAEWLAVHDSLLPPMAGEDLVARTVLFEVAIMALRRMACEHQLVVDATDAGRRGRRAQP